VCQVAVVNGADSMANGRSGAGTNLKVEGGGGQIFFVVPLHFFGSKSTISRFGERFRDGQYSLVGFLFAVLLRAVLSVCL